MKIKLPVTWEMCGIVEVDVPDNSEDPIGDAIEIFDKTSDDISLPEGEYVDASFELTDSEKEFIESYN